MTHISLIFSRILRRRYQLCAMGIASILYAPSIFAQDNKPVAPTDAALAVVSVQERYPGGTIQSVEAADRALADVEMERAAIEAQFTTEQRACFVQFFANACVDEAKERRRVSLAKIRPVEIEANVFKRRMRVIERDKALAEKHADAERKRLQREQQEQANPAASVKDPEAAREPAPADVNQKSTNATTTERVRQHEERLKRLEAEDRANAQKRAENEAAYEKKVQKALERQRRVEEKKKEKELEKAKQASQPKQ